MPSLPKPLAALLGSATAAASGALISSLVRLALSPGPQEGSWVRERIFVIGLDALVIGAFFGLIGMFLLRGRSDRAFLLGMAVGIGPWSLIPAVVSVLLVGLGWRFLPTLPNWFLAAGGLLALAFPLLSFAMEASEAAFPMEARPSMPALAADAPPAPQSPDVVLIVCDTLRADAILDPRVETPNLDRMRAEGTWAKSAMAPANQTLPSHLSLLFALDIESVGMRHNLSRWPSPSILKSESEALSLADRFGQAGYRTKAVVANKLLSSSDPEDAKRQFPGEGFDVWHDTSRRDGFNDFLAWNHSSTLLGFLATHRIVLKKHPLNFFLRRTLLPQDLAGKRMHFLEGETSVSEVRRSLEELTVDERPYFLFVNILEPHDPYLPPEGFAETISADIPRPGGFEDGYAGEFLMRRQVHIGCRDDLDPAGYLPTGDFLHGLYLEEVAYFDVLLGRTLESIEATGRPTVILFVSDHGEGFGQHRDSAHGHTLFDTELKVPFILTGPGVPAGRELDVVPELVDGSRTLLELAGLDPGTAGGRNVLAPDYTQRVTLSFRIGELAATDGHWKVIAKFDYLNKETPVEGEYLLEPLHLFDLSQDPDERKNLLLDHAEEAERLLAAVRERLKSDVYPLLEEPVRSARENQTLAELGYIDSASH